MYLELKEKYKSIHQLKVVNKKKDKEEDNEKDNEKLADFSIVTGDNGSGKSHLAEALNQDICKAYDKKKPDEKKTDDADEKVPVPYLSKMYNYESFNLAAAHSNHNSQPVPPSFTETTIFPNNFFNQLHNKTSIHQKEKFFKEFTEIQNITSQYYETPLFYTQQNDKIPPINYNYFMKIDHEPSYIVNIINSYIHLSNNITLQRDFQKFKDIKIKDKIEEFNNYLKEHDPETYTMITGLGYDNCALFSYNDMNILQNIFQHDFPELLKTYCLSDNENKINPIDEFNNILKDIGFETYRLELTSDIAKPQKGIALQIPPIHLKNNQYAISLNDHNAANLKRLSNGEKTLFAMASLFYSIVKLEGKRPNLIVFDEVESSLHPKMIKVFIEKIVDELLLKKGVKVMMITHSPTTIAIAQQRENQENTAFYKLEDKEKKGHKILNEINAQEAIESLLIGVNELRITSLTHKAVYCEAQRDVRRLTKIYDALSRLYMPLHQHNFKIRFYTVDLTQKLITALGPLVENKNLDIKATKITLKKLINEGSGKNSIIPYVTEENKKNPEDKIYGLIDYDFDHDFCNKINDEKIDSILILGGKNRYAIENYILDPLILLFTTQLCGGNKKSIQGYLENNQEVKKDLDEVIKKLTEKYKKSTYFSDLSEDEQKRMLEEKNVFYGTDKSLSFEIPNFILEMNGHAYETIVRKSSYIPLRGGKDLVDHIMETTFEHEIIQKIISHDFYQTFETLCNE